MSLLDNLTPEAVAELRGLVQEEIAAALQQHAERRRWMTPQECATYLGCSLAAVRGRIERGSIPARRNGSRLLIDREALDAQIDAG